MTQWLLNRFYLQPLIFRVVIGSARLPFHNQFKLIFVVSYVNMKGVNCVKCRLFPTIAATAGDQDVRWRGLLWAWAEGVQTVEGVLAAVPWRGERVAALRVPAVDVATVSDAAFRALCLLCLLNIWKHVHRMYQMHKPAWNGYTGTKRYKLRVQWLNLCCVFLHLSDKCPLQIHSL